MIVVSIVLKLPHKINSSDFFGFTHVTVRHKHTSDRTDAATRKVEWK